MAQAHQGDRQVYGHLPQGCIPPDSLIWANRDNNEAFLAQSIMMTLNTTALDPEHAQGHAARGLPRSIML
jgi:hypothetical protein